MLKFNFLVGKKELKELEEISKSKEVSVAYLIRKSIKEYLEKNARQ